MSRQALSASPTSFTSFGDLLKYLRRRAQLTQRDLSIAVGYSEPQISYLEKNRRLPDVATVSARFVPALDLRDEPALASRLVELATAARREADPARGDPPFKGLHYFEEADADLFFGRTRAVAACTARLEQLAAGGKAFLLIYGMSGCGKSSLLRAGLLPSLTAAGAAAGISVWRRCLVRLSLCREHQSLPARTLRPGRPANEFRGPTAPARKDSRRSPYCLTDACQRFSNPAPNGIRRGNFRLALGHR